MPSLETFRDNRAGFIVMLISHFGGGKTLQAHTFPGCYTISCDPAGIEVIRGTVLEENLVWYEYLLSENRKELKDLFKPTDDVNERQSIYGCLAHARELIAEGKVKTLVLDGFTYFNDNRVAEIWEHEVVRNAQGEQDTQAMYGNLARSMQRFLISDLLPMTTRQNVNVVLTCHLQRLSEEQVQGPDSTDTRRAARSRRKSVLAHLKSDLAPRIEGGMREKIEGMVGASIYLDRRLDPTKGIVYEAICDLAPGFGTIVPAKNRYGMVPKIDITNGSLWEELQPARIQQRRKEWEGRGKK